MLSVFFTHRTGSDCAEVLVPAHYSGHQVAVTTHSNVALFELAQTMLVPKASLQCALLPRLLAAACVC
jgi:hypothetical protein